MTNREWMQSLTDEELANFLTDGLYVRDIRIGLDGFNMFAMSVHIIAHRYNSSRLGIEEWFKQNQEFEVVK